MPTKKIKIIIVDDHNIIVNGIKSMLENVNDIVVIGEAQSGKELLQKLTTLPDTNLVLMDIKMPEMNGIEATKAVLSLRPDIKILALTMFDTEDYVTNILQAGATGYILKNTSVQDLCNAIRKVASGGTYFCDDVTKVIMNKLIGRGGVKTGRVNTEIDPKELTQREQEILKFIALEMTNHEISERLFISPRTVHSHRRNLMQKIGVKNSAGIVRYALKNDILTKEEQLNYSKGISPKIDNNLGAEVQKDSDQN